MNKFLRFTTALLSLVIISGSAYGMFHRRGILDYIALRGYEPSDRVVKLADDTTMRDDLRRVFYVNHPQLNNKDDFRNNCPSTEQSIVLGCYIESKGIFLHDVNDQRLNGIVQVTAAHEVLHAEYDRLSGKERNRIDKLTQDYFATQTNERLKKTIEQYRQKDPSVVPNELHSILGTEVRTLPPELEDYYSRYFTNRVKIVEFSEKYEQTFVDLTDQVDSYDVRLKELKGEIDSAQVEIDGLSDDIEADRARLDSLMNSGRTAEYNAAVPEFNSKVNSFNSLVNNTKRLITEFNSIVEKRNSIATTEQELVKAINSNETTKKTE